MAANAKPPITGGFSYYVSDEQLAAFARLTPMQRLEWVEAARQFTLLTQTPETRDRHERLRRGLPIVP
ncbi:hypothetical protein [Azonexus sp.]|uniref:hypothetical protein n=1 Tax=Azonexus sp. TaxID=1872668 RepID=UPI0028229967|nr:hypothetical protein [Azonexus sp.]MDR1995546.1 hypothetical protein [Azonexus sp.]